MVRYIRRLLAADRILRKIVFVARARDGDEAHRIMPHFWPHIRSADRLYNRE